MSAICGDLLSPTPSTSLDSTDYFDFDLAVVGLGFHHFADPAFAAKRLVERLKPGTGVLLVIDFTSHAPIPHGGTSPHGGHSFHAAKQTVAHHGFAEEETRKVFEGAGCIDVDMMVLGKGFTMGEGETKVARSVFLARGRRA